MRKVIDYKTVWAENIEELNAIAKQMISDGWEPMGTASFNCNTLKAVQTMVKYDNAEQEVLNE